TKFKSVSEPTTEERASAQRGFGANFGTWSVSEADKTLTRHYDGALVPNNEGIDFKSSVSLAGDELKLTGELGSSIRGDFVYRRAR
ncbi:MAG: lipocalin-like domain-containing protein, partial [Betaproteobacteria bacterium]